MKSISIIFTFFVSVVATDIVIAADPDHEIDVRDVERQITQRIDDYRGEHDLQPVETDKSLQTAAQNFAQFMAEESKYGHRANGQTPAQRAKSAGYDYCVVRENIAYRTNTGDVTADSLVDVLVTGWIDSPPHRENILGEHVSQTGVGIATTDGATFYAVQMFARPRSASFQVSVLNKTSITQTVTIDDSDTSDSVEIPPSTTLTMTRCVPVTLRLSEDDQSRDVAQTIDLAITQDGFADRN